MLLCYNNEFIKVVNINNSTNNIDSGIEIILFIICLKRKSILIDTAIYYSNSGHINIKTERNDRIKR